MQNPENPGENQVIELPTITPEPSEPIVEVPSLSDALAQEKQQAQHVVDLTSPVVSPRPFNDVPENHVEGDFTCGSRSIDGIRSMDGFIVPGSVKKHKSKNRPSISDLTRDATLYAGRKIQNGMVKVDEIYHKFKQRDRSDSILGASFNLVNCTVGAGVLSLPFVFQNCGILLGIPLLIVGAIVNLVTMIYLFNSHELALDRDPNVKDYENIAYLAYGAIASFIIKVSIVVYSFGALITYIIILTDFSIPIWKQFAGPGTVMSERWLAALIIIIPLFLISLIKRMGDLRWISYLSVLCSTAFIIFLIASLASGVTEKVGEVALGKVNLNMFRVLGIITFAYSCHTNLCPINYEFKRENHPRVKKSIYLSSAISCFIYVMTGLFGYLCFLDGTKGNLLNSFNYDQGRWYNLLFSGIFCVTVFVTYPLICVPLKISIDNLINPLWRWKLPLGTEPKMPESFKKYNFIKDTYIWFWDSTENIRYVIFSFLIAAICYVSGIYIPNVSDVFSIVGATAGSLLGYIIPITVWIKLTKHPWRSWRVIMSIIILIFAILLSIFVTIITILEVAKVI